MNIKVYSVDTDNCDKSRPDGVEVFRENGLFHDPKRQANMYMALSHMFVTADISVYLAGNILLKNPREVTQMVDDWLGKSDIAIFHHHKRNCVYKEANCISNKDDPEVMQAQMQKYKDAGYPAENGLVETGMIIRKHNKRVEAFNNAWFAELCLHSKRSQLSFNYMVSLFPQLKVNVIKGNIRKNKYLFQRKHNRTYLDRTHIRGVSDNNKELKAIKKDGYRTIVIVRSRYEEKISDLRLELFQKYCINSLKKQTDKNFEIHVLVKPETVDQVKQLDWGDLIVKFIEEPPDIGWNAFALVLRKQYLNEPNLQIRMDNDDWVEECFMRKIKAMVRGQNSMLVTFHPTKHIHGTENRYFSQKTYGENRPSMFLGIYQENSEHWILDQQHGRMGQFFKNRLYIKKFGLCNLVIHDENKLNKP